MIIQLQSFIYIMINLEKAQPTHRKLSDLTKKLRAKNKSSYQESKVTNPKLFSVVQKIKLSQSNFSKSLVGGTQVIDRYKDNRSNQQYRRLAINNSLNYTAFNLVQKERYVEYHRRKSPKILKNKSGNKSLPILKQQNQFTFQQSRIQLLKASLLVYQTNHKAQKSIIKSINKNTINITPSKQKNSFITQAIPSQILTSRNLYESSQRKRPNTLRDSKVKQIVKQTLYDIEIERMLKKRQEGNRSIFSFREKQIFIQKMKKIFLAQKK